MTLPIEVSESALGQDRSKKLRAYARDDIPVYGIVNRVDRQVEVYSGQVAGSSPRAGFSSEGVTVGP